MSIADLAGTESSHAKLTRREIEVLEGIAEGRSSKQVAEALFVSKPTIDFHLANIYYKLRVNNRIQAANVARRLGLLKGVDL